MQNATSETEIKSLYLSICVHHYTLRAPCPKGQGTRPQGALRKSQFHVHGGQIRVWKLIELHVEAWFN